MILWVRDRFRKLSSYHYQMIVATILVPVIWTVAFNYFEVDCLVVRVIIDVGVFLVWALFVVIVVGLMVERDMAEASRLLSQQTGPLAEQVHRLREEHGDLIADVRLQVEDLESRTRSTLERLGADLPPKSVSLRAGTIFGAVGMSAPVVTSGGSKWARLRQRVIHRLRRAMLWVWEVVYGKSERG